ncbi:hypothetical protein TthSNM17_10610 [Thermus thermophilus]|nr:hypothetical protein TthSNM17_10610 [Thermus thermophilus]
MASFSAKAAARTSRISGPGLPPPWRTRRVSSLSRWRLKTASNRLTSRSTAPKALRARQGGARSCTSRKLPKTPSHLAPYRPMEGRVGQSG